MQARDCIYRFVQHRLHYCDNLPVFAGQSDMGQNGQTSALY